MLEQHVIETPENIAFDYQVAGIGSRFLAILVDSLIQGTLSLIFYVAYGVVTLVLVISQSSGTVGWIPTVILVAGLFVIEFGYFILFEITRGGRTPGKELAGLRVVKENGHPLTPLDVIIRNLLRIIDFLPVGYGVGVITMFFNSRSKRLGDYAAGTLVVRVGQSVKLSDLAPRAAAEFPAPDLDVAPLKETDVELVESYLRRRTTLQNADSLGAEIARHIRARLGLSDAEQPTAPASAITFLEQVVAAYRAKHSAAGRG